MEGQDSAEDRDRIDAELELPPGESEDQAREDRRAFAARFGGTR